MAPLMFVASATVASAQGFFYKHVVGNDRVHLFTIAEEAERFEKTGETSKVIDEAVSKQSAQVPRIEWRDGKTRITTDFAYLEISNRIQFRYTHELPDEISPILAGTAAAGDDKGSFRIRRAKFKLEGWFWQQNNLTYELQLNWPAVTGSNPGAILEDANIAWDPQGRGTFRLLGGQFKVPSFLQQLTSSGNQSFVDRSLVSDQYARGRDIGVAVQGVLFANKLEYRAGVFNGNGLTQTANDNAAMQLNARVMWQPNGNQRLVQRAWVSGALYSEGDFESTTVPLYAVAFNFERNDFHRATTGNDLKSDIYAVDGIFKFNGICATGAYFWRDREPEIGSEFNSDGYYIQTGVMLNKPRTWEAAIRYGERDANDAIDNDDEAEVRGALSYYYRRHALKFQMDFGQVRRGLGASNPDTRKDHELRLQAQFIF